MASRNVTLDSDAPRRWPTVEVRRGLRHLRGTSFELKQLIAEVGPFRLSLHDDLFDLLVRVIVSQQVSMKGARTVAARLLEQTGKERFDPATITKLGVDQVRSAGMTNARASYIVSAAEAVQAGSLPMDSLWEMPDAEAMKALVSVRGIGRWTAEMILIFGLGRTDVFPPGDLGVRNAIGRVFDYSASPPPKECEVLAEQWRPYRTLATWYLWRLADIDDRAAAELEVYPV
ncbi:DNA-3-methyladenine glycosylase family protein [Stratiformator vulcanicus]|uniref:DNA-3-methyladenine glycosylase II n=1 Tax=Stratiformator vulcanicus TaxID=2527980 RepID=A0A517R618_9PLAN|nr:DNA-3-methyladenine glycosylase [Stratiformator vulcanicus]QDT39285.1 DNA-3-methyladenine glycosylase [Stratiformator vulcanicus]